MEEMTMTVSPICKTKDGFRQAFVRFENADASAEGTIPDCRIIKSTGFTEEETEQLELYMRMNLGELKRQAASTSVFKALMK